VAKKTEENQEEVKKTETFKLKKAVKEQGYFVNIGGRPFNVSKGHREPVRDEHTGNMKKQFVYGSVIENKKETGKDYFENLTDYQIHLLAQAGVIELTKEQGEKYNSWLAEFYKNPDKFIPKV
jgi:hypothetical protein